MPKPTKLENGLTAQYRRALEVHNKWEDWDKSSCFYYAKLHAR